MRVSVVIPVMNDTRIERAINSVLAQRAEVAPEIVIVNGGTSAEVERLLREYAEHIDIMISEKDCVSDSCENCDCGVKTCSIARTAERTMGCSSAPLGVMTISRPARVSSSSPKCSRSRPKAWLKAD